MSKCVRRAKRSHVYARARVWLAAVSRRHPNMHECMVGVAGVPQQARLKVFGWELSDVFVRGFGRTVDGGAAIEVRWRAPPEPSTLTAAAPP